MPLLENTVNEETFNTGGGAFSFSGAKLEHLEEAGATEYTLATIAVDISSSVRPFRDEMEAALISAVESLQQHPRKDYILVRLLAFNTQVQEVHGFRLLSECDLDSYRDILDPYGMTALYEATWDSLRAAAEYGQKLLDSDFFANAITVTITDGDNNVTTTALSQVKAELDRIVQGEVLESHMGILVGINISDSTMKRRLDTFHQESGFQQFVPLEDANPNTLAKLAGFISRSVSSQSVSLGSGGPSQPLSF